jgi:hypothetical protein
MYIRIIQRISSQKLHRKAIEADPDLRLLVAHANLLDSLTIIIARNRENPQLAVIQGIRGTYRGRDIGRTRSQSYGYIAEGYAGESNRRSNEGTQYGTGEEYGFNSAHYQLETLPELEEESSVAIEELDDDYESEDSAGDTDDEGEEYELSLDMEALSLRLVNESQRGHSSHDSALQQVEPDIRRSVSSGHGVDLLQELPTKRSHPPKFFHLGRPSVGSGFPTWSQADNNSFHSSFGDSAEQVSEPSKADIFSISFLKLIVDAVPSLISRSLPTSYLGKL